MEIIMKKITVLCLATTLIGSISIASAGGYGYGGHYDGGYGRHHGGRYGGHHGGFRSGYGYGALGLGLGLGMGYGLGSYYGGNNNYGYNYPPAVVAVPTAPPIYIQQTPAPVVQQSQPNYWYYCQNPSGYYPYVRECASGWQQVEPTPPAPSR
jgi:hypothetical protein